VFGLSYHDGRRLRGAIASSAGQAPQVTVALASRLGKGRPRTVIGTLAGAGARKDRIMIVCAHGDSDSGGPGADDNASGVATLLEVARALSSAAADGLLPADRPQVRFIVWGAEYHSSRAWVESHGADLDRLDAVINYDETGTGAERDAVYFEGNDIPWNAPLLRTLESVASDHAGRPGFPTAWTSNPALGGTDAYVFLPRRYDALGVTDARIPSTTVFTAAWDLPTRVPQTDGWRSSGWDEPGDLFVDYSAYYHSSGDIPARTTEAEPWNMERCASLVVVALYRLMRSQGAGAAADTPGAVRAPGRPR
jgi:Zn-dependent M28 family amino/carboxypeptidase